MTDGLCRTAVLLLAGAMLATSWGEDHQRERLRTQTRDAQAALRADVEDLQVRLNALEDQDGGRCGR